MLNYQRVALGIPNDVWWLSQLKDTPQRFFRQLSGPKTDGNSFCGDALEFGVKYEEVVADLGQLWLPSGNLRSGGTPIAGWFISWKIHENPVKMNGG